MQFPFGSEKPQDYSIIGYEKKLLMVFTDNSGVVDDDRGAYRRQFNYLVHDFFSALTKNYVRGKSSIAVICFRWLHRTDGLVQVGR